MRKRLIAVFLTLTLLVSCLGTVGFAASTYLQEDVERQLDELMAKYCGTYWTANYQGATQCKGFADMIFNELFGTQGPGPYSGNRYTLPEAESRSCSCLGILSGAQTNYDSLKALLSQALPGDYVQCVRYTGTQHSMLVVEVSDAAITFFDCNLKGSCLCAVYTYTWDDAVENLTRGISLYRHDGYVPSETYQIFFDATGGECELDAKPITVGSPYGALPTPERTGYHFDYWYMASYSSAKGASELQVDANTIKTTYTNTYLKAHWTENEAPCYTQGHSWEVRETVSASCIADGYVEEVCTLCGETRQTDIQKAIGHSYQCIGVVPATNVEDGSETYQCEACGALYTATVLCQLHRFTDIAETDWFYPYVRTMVSDALMNGTSETTFDPNKTLTRAMLVTVLYRMQGEPETAPADFTDVEQAAWYGPAVGWASENGVVTGFPDHTFRPNAPVTREQAAAILFRYAPVLGRGNAARASLNGYRDKDKISAYATEAMSWANACGILSGFPDETLRPQGSAVRSQIAKMIVTFLENTEAAAVG